MVLPGAVNSIRHACGGLYSAGSSHLLFATQACVEHLLKQWSMASVMVCLCSAQGVALLEGVALLK